MNRPASPPTRWRERADRVRDAALEPLARQLGYRPDPRNPARWKLPGSVLSISGCRFFDHHRGGGGGGVIDLVMHARGCRFQAARQWRDCASDGTRGRAAPSSARRAIAARRSERRLSTGWSARAASGVPVAAQADLGNARMHERVGIAAFSCSVPDIQQRSWEMTVQLAAVNEFPRSRLRVFPTPVDPSLPGEQSSRRPPHRQ